MITSVIQIAKSYAVSRYSLMRGHSISHRLMIAYLRQPYAFFLNRHSGEMSTRVLSEAQQVVNQFLPGRRAYRRGCTVIGHRRAALVGRPAGRAGRVRGSGRHLRRDLRVQPSSSEAVRTCAARPTARGFGSPTRPSVASRISSFWDGKGPMRIDMPSLEKDGARAGVGAAAVQVPQLALQAVALSGVILLCLVMLDPQGFASGAALGGILPTLGVFAFAGQRLLPELSKLYRSLSQIQAGGAAVEAVYDDLIDKAGSGMLPGSPPVELGLSRSLELERMSRIAIPMRTCRAERHIARASVPAKRSVSSAAPGPARRPWRI